MAINIPVLSTIVGGVKTIFTSWVKLKTTKIEAEGEYHKQMAQSDHDYDMMAMAQKQFSLTDELCMATLLSPFWVAWFKPEAAKQWVGFISGLPAGYWFILIGILSSTFGLRWYVRGKTFKMKGETTQEIVNE